MKLRSILIFVSMITFLQVTAQDTLSTKKTDNAATKIVKGFAIYPIEKQIGYRSNLTKKWFTDFKGGMTYSALPFLVLEINRDCRFVNKERIKVYSGIGLTFDSYIPGVEVPFGIEFVPLPDVKQLSIITEVAPKMTFGPTNFLNVSFSPHIGVCYYLRVHSIKNNSKK